MKKLAILGPGVVGGSCAEISAAGRRSARTERGGTAGAFVCAGAPRELPDRPYKDKAVTDFSVIEHDADVFLVIETIGGCGAALEYVRRALAAGKHVVTANKQLIAEHGTELLALAEGQRCKPLFEASVGGGIPVLHPLSQCLGANEIYEVRGILNGTTNFILTQMLERGQSYESALRDAQTRGYAEQDPTADVEGIDAGRKVCILADMMFGKKRRPVPRQHDRYFRHHGGGRRICRGSRDELRLLGRAVRQGQSLTVFVSPHFIAGTQPLAPVSGVLNAVEVLGSSVGAVLFSGPGAGGPATASAVLADVIDIVRNPGRSQPVSWSAEPATLLDPEELEASFFFRTKAPQRKPVNRRSVSVRWLPDAGAFHGGFTQKTTRRALRASGLALDAVWALVGIKTF